MAAILFPELQFSDASGSPLASGKVYTYIAGTTTPTPTYTDAGGLTSVGNYVDLDANGRPNSGNGIWLGTTVLYKLVIKDSSGTTIQTLDNVASGGFNGSSSFITAVSETGLTGGRVLTTSTTNAIVDAGAGSTIQVQRTALTGDVTASANSNATTIASGAVTLAKMANIATASLIGRATAGTGVPEALTAGVSLTIAGTTISRAALTGEVTASANSNATVVDIVGRSVDSTPDYAADYVMTYDTSATTNKRVLLNTINKGFPICTTSGYYYGPGVLGVTKATIPTASTLTIGTVYFVPFISSTDFSFFSFVVNISTLQAAKNMRLAMYNSAAGTSRPTGSAFYDSGNISTGATGLTGGTPSYRTLSANTLYWLAFNTDADTAQFSCLAANVSNFPYFGGKTDITTSMPIAYQQTSAFGAFPTVNTLILVEPSASTALPFLNLST